MRPIKALRAEVMDAKEMNMTQEEYEDAVMQAFSNPVLLNEVHKMLNELATQAVYTAPDMPTLAFVRGGVKALEGVLKKASKPQDKITVRG